MAAKASKCLVIDASIARAAGGEESTYPTSVNCRDCLIAVLEICHRIVMTSDIRQEWDKHQSRFAREWLRRMIARRKLYPVEIRVDHDFWQQIETLADMDKQRAEMIKDLRLIEAAIATDKTIISLDDNTARNFFGKASRQVEKLQDVIWVNPDKDEEQVIQWLTDGAAPEPARLLVAWKSF